MLLDYEDNSDEKINNYTVQASKAANGSIVCYKSNIYKFLHSTLIYKIQQRNKLAYYITLNKKYIEKITNNKTNKPESLPRRHNAYLTGRTSLSIEYPFFWTS